MKLPSRQQRRLRAPKPPLGVVTEYQRLFHSLLDRTQALTLSRVLAAWEAHPKARHGVRADAPGSAYIRKALNGIELQLQETFSDPKLTTDIDILAARVSKKGEIEFRRLVGVSVHSEVGIAAKLAAFRDRNVGLIKDIGADELERLTDTLEQAEIGAWRVEELRSTLLDEFDITKSKADFWARDQVLKLNGQLNQTRQTNAGINEYIWTTSNDERVRETHDQLDGSRQSWDSAPVVSEDGRTAHPGDDYQCRCTAYPIIPSLDDVSGDYQSPVDE